MSGGADEMSTFPKGGVEAFLASELKTTSKYYDPASGDGLPSATLTTVLRWSSDLLLATECLSAVVWLLVICASRRDSAPYTTASSATGRGHSNGVRAGFLAFFLSTGLCALVGAVGHLRGWFRLSAWSPWAVLVYFLMTCEAAAAVFIGGVLICHPSKARWWALGSVGFLLFAVTPQVLLCPSDMLAAASVLVGKVWLLVAAAVAAAVGPPTARPGSPEIEMMPVTNKCRAEAKMTAAGKPANLWTKGCLALVGACTLMLAGGGYMAGTELWLRLDARSSACRRSAFSEYLVESPLTSGGDADAAYATQPIEQGVADGSRINVTMLGKDVSSVQNHGGLVSGVRGAPSSAGNVSFPVGGSPFFALKTFQIALANGLMHRLAPDEVEEQIVPRVGSYLMEEDGEAEEGEENEILEALLNSNKAYGRSNESVDITHGKDEVYNAEAEDGATNLARLHFALNHWDVDDRAVECIAKTHRVGGQSVGRTKSALQVLQHRIAIMHLFYATAVPVLLLAYHWITASAVLPS